MPATVIGSASIANITAFNQLVRIPVGALPGHVLYAGLLVSINSATITNLRGMTQEASLLPTSAVNRLYVLSKLLTQADIDTGVFTLVLSAQVNSLAVSVLLGNARSSYRDGAATTATASATSVTCTAVITGTANELLLMIGSADASTRTVSGWTAPLATQVEIGDSRRLALATGTQVSAGSSGSKTLTFSGTDRNSAYLVAIVTMPEKVPMRSSIMQQIRPRPIQRMGV